MQRSKDTTIAALTGITLPERAARIKTLPSLVRGLSPRNDGSVQVLDSSSPRRLLIPKPRGSCRGV
jgi:hypothetical protein